MAAFILRNNEGVVTAIGFICWIGAIIYYFVYHNKFNEAVRDIKDNNKVTKRNELSALLGTLNLENVVIPEKKENSQDNGTDYTEVSSFGSASESSASSAASAVAGVAESIAFAPLAFANYENSSDDKKTTDNNIRICPSCGAAIDDDYVFCISCGAKMKDIKLDILDVNKEIVDQAIEKGILNDTGFTYWVYKTDNLTLSDEKYRKLYLFNRKWNGEELNSITIKEGKKEYEKSVTKEKGFDGNVYYCSFKTNLKYSITKMNVDGIAQEATGNQTKVKKEETDILDAIKELNPEAVYQPVVGDDYWLCTCGRINNTDDHKCVCGKTDDEIIDICTKDYDEIYIRKFLNNIGEFDLTKSFEDNINDLFEKFQTDYPNISLDKLKDEMDMFEYLEKYNSMKEAQ